MRKLVAVLMGFLICIGSSVGAYAYLMTNFSSVVTYNFQGYAYHEVVLSEAGYSLWRLALVVSILVGLAVTILIWRGGRANYAKSKQPSIRAISKIQQRTQTTMHQASQDYLQRLRNITRR